MRTAIVRRVVFAMAAGLLGGVAAGAQAPGATGPGLVEHRPPFERTFRESGRFHRWWNDPHMVQQLKLTEDQRKGMDQILYQHREKLIDLDANLERSELAMQPLMSADQPDRAALQAQIDKIVAARADLERANAGFLLDIRMQLTADQWKQLRNLRAERMMRGGPGEHRMERPRRDRQAPPQAPGAPQANPPAGGSQGPGSASPQ